MLRTDIFCNKRIIIDSKRSIDLNYYLLEANELEDKDKYYGIEIEQEEFNNDKKISEIEKVEGISYSKDEVKDIMNTLYKYEVTPISMIEIIDDIITARDM